jgi:hypothetical protein
VYFGGVPASSLTVNSSTSITATSPPQFAGTYDVTVVTYAGTSALSSNDRFAVSTATGPAVSSLGTSTGTTAGGTSVTVNGSNFTGATQVMFGLVPAASFSIVSSSQITAVSPPQAAGTVDITVTTYSGSSAASSSDQFSYTNASTPSVTSLGTSSGSTAGGTAVTINGSGFTGATAVSFGTVAAASFTVVSDSQISAVSPAQASGTVDVTVTTFAGTSSTGSADHFTYSNASTPSVSAVTPSSGSAAGGDLITVTGSAFTGATGVSFGSTAAASFTVINDNALLVTAPPGTAGTVDITVTTYAGTSSTGSSDHYTYNSITAPSITSLNPSTGGTGGGTVVTISGSNFLNADGVFFGGIPAASYTIVNSGEIVAVTPPQTAGTIDVTVTYAGTTSALGSADRFQVTVPAPLAPVVSSLGTSSGSTAGGTSVTLTGSGYTGASAVTFGGIPAQSFVVNSDTSITAVSPSQAAATVDVVVSTPTGTSAVSSSDHFTYNAASTPSVSGLSVTSGSTAGGLGVTVTGSYFTGATGVNFGTVAAAFTVLNDSTLVATAPPQAAGTIDITVTTPSGTSSTGSSDHFTYNAASTPAVSSVTPSSGTVLGGETITVFGSAFTAATAVKFGSTAATAFTVLSDNALIATAPAGTAGTVDLTVTTPSGTSSTGSSDHYTDGSAPSAPSVSSLGTTSGGSGGGTVVIISGSGFTNASAVSFGSYPTASFFVNSDSQVTAVAPPQAAATIDVTVTTPSGTSSTSSSDHFTYSAATAPSVSSVSPNSGSTAGGQYVTISGSHFTGASAVSFGSTAAASFTVVADGTIFATAPAESAGTIDVTVTTPSGTSSTGSSDHFTSQTDAALTSVTGINISPHTNFQMTTPIASFTDIDLSGTASQFTASIDWGNGTYSLGTVTSSGNNGLGQPTFSVSGTVTYTAAGTYTVKISIQDVGGATGSATATATVTNPPGAPPRPHPQATGTTATATHGVAFGGSVASFVGDISGGTASSYTATINWGNGHTSAGVIQATGPNTFIVVGSQTYSAAGTYTVAITITDSNGGSTTVDSTIVVAETDAPAPVDDATAVASTSPPEEPSTEWGVEEAGVVAEWTDAVFVSATVGEAEAPLSWDETASAVAPLADELFAAL